MAKAIGVPAMTKADAARERRWQVESALRTLQEAGEIVADKKLMAEVKAMAGEKAAEMKIVEKQADKLAKMGRISPKQMAKSAAH
jgi:hypothetical protein